MRKLIWGSLCYGSMLSVFAEEGTAAASNGGSFISVVADSGTIGISIWLMLFVTSLITCWLIIDAFLNVREAKLCPQTVIQGVLESLNAGDVGSALSICQEKQSMFSATIEACLTKLPKGFNSMHSAAGSAIEKEEERLMQKINYLNLCGAVAPMLGLLGTVTGMVSAFFTLGTTSGAEKAQLLALAISQALYTTAAGLVISVPALVAYNIFKNKATNIVIHLENNTSDILEEIKDRV